ncbi:hypothetical protein NUU61_006613 [Penicillium alfredii]|uniref:Uncharacterized protein n=1 Tax=Penicillium alfredii TaxID=1506179 RepID=A0A9W9F184_9EURO|nr:uncharacterized protein NUU61_006613 [Penicillium alfredii]KAJ5091743.1 hypothetical protein NUU61_006613 [Penicillium alfredii]
MQFSPFLALSTSSRARSDSSHQGPRSDISSSPPSSTTTCSPPPSPTAASRRYSQHRHIFSHASPHHHRHNQPQNQHTHQPYNGTTPTDNNNDSNTTLRNPESGLPNSPAHCGISILPCAILRGRSSLMMLRRRPSAVDMVLNEERLRCDGDAIERQGLGLMEPRPVEMDLRASANANPSANAAVSSGASNQSDHNPRAVLGAPPVQQPRFVMGGIFEVMEEQA